MSDELVPCNHIFSNGTEFEFFIETQCEKCKMFTYKPIKRKHKEHIIEGQESLFKEVKK